MPTPHRDKDTGQLKGDGLVTFLKEPSVELALQLLDGAHFRATGPPMTVSLAKFEMKGEKYVPKQKERPKGGKGPKKQQLEKLEKKLGWGGFDDKQPPEKVCVARCGCGSTPCGVFGGLPRGEGGDERRGVV